MSTSLGDWQQTWQELGTPVTNEGLYNRLIACWSEPHRHYHTMQHLRECLAQFAPVRGDARRPAEVELALWFHDAVYDPRRADNELLSANWAVDPGCQAGTLRRIR